MLSTRREVFAFLGRTLLALPVALVLWYFTAPFFDDVAGRIAKPAITMSSGGTITDFSYRHRQVLYSLQLRAPYRMYQKSQPPAIAELEVNASLYTFGMALFLALSAALKVSRRPGRIALGCVALALVPGWGVAFDALKQLGATAALATYLEWTPGFREAIALGYQAGTLLLPTLVPIALWLGLNREILQAGPAAAAEPSTPEAGR
jgi:hypothetical protein